MAPSNGPPDPQTEDEPAVPPPPPGAPDGVVGVAPHATIISIRQSSRAFEPVNPSSAGPNSDEKVKAGTLDSVARAVVHAANMGAKVINISVTACLPAAAPGDQRVLGAALWYAATVKDAVIVAAAGNDGEAGCGNNPMYDPLDPSDPRDWHQVTVVSSPSWFSDYVLSVGAVDAYGAALDKSMSGPWVVSRHREPTSWVYRHKAADRSMPTRRRGQARRICRSGAPAFRRPTSAASRHWCGPNSPS